MGVRERRPKVEMIRRSGKRVCTKVDSWQEWQFQGEGKGGSREGVLVGTNFFWMREMSVFEQYCTGKDILLGRKRIVRFVTGWWLCGHWKGEESLQLTVYS